VTPAAEDAIRVAAALTSKAMDMEQRRETQAPRETEGKTSRAQLLVIASLAGLS